MRKIHIGHFKIVRMATAVIIITIIVIAVAVHISSIFHTYNIVEA